MELSNTNLKKVVDSEKPVLIDFWAPWCGPCKMQAPILDEVADEMSGEVVVAKVNIDEHQDLAVKYGVMSIPTLLLLKKGNVVAKTIGLTTKDKLVSMIASSK